MSTPNTTQQTQKRLGALRPQRDAGQYRSGPRVRAGQPALSEGPESAQQILRNAPLASMQRIDTERVPDNRAITQFGEPSQSAPCPPGFCGFDPLCSDRQCPGHPSHTTQPPPNPFADTNEQLSGMQMLAYALIALAITGIAVVLGRAIAAYS